jgi:hypothetical protein
MALGVQLGFRVPGEEVRDAGLAYDVWLVAAGDTDRSRPIRTTTSASQHDPARFVFPPIELDSGVTFQASGAVTGRATQDGRIDLSVDTWHGCLGERGSVGGGGRTRIAVTPGETVELRLPRRQRSTAPRVRAVQEACEPPFALRVTARRAW